MLTIQRSPSRLKSDCYFCGHGTGKQGLVLQDNNGLEKLVSTEALSNLFGLCSGWVQCVLLNACYSEVQANAIIQHINYAVGMNHEIRDDAAIAFATGFYQALGYGQPIEQAYRFGCNAIQLQISDYSTVRSFFSEEKRKLEIATTVERVVIPEHLKPVLKIKPELTTSIDESMPGGKGNLLPSTQLEIQSYIDRALEKEIPRGKTHPELQEDLGNQNIQFNSHATKPKKTRKLLVGGILATLVLVVTSSLLFSPKTTEMTAQEFFVRGEDKYEKNDYQGAITDFTQVLQIERDDADAYYKRGFAYSTLKEYQKAIADYTQVIKLIPHNAIIYYHRGDAYYALQEYQKAITDYTQAISLAQNGASVSGIYREISLAYHNRGLAYRKLKDEHRAIEDFHQAIQIAPNDATSYYHRGAAYYALQEYQKAIADYTQVIKLKPYSSLAYYHRGDIYSKLEEYQKAVTDYIRAIEFNQNWGEFSETYQGIISAYQNRGDARFALEEYEKAIADYTQVLERDPDNANAYYTKGNAYSELEKYQKAIKNYEQARELYQQQGNELAHKYVLDKIRELKQQLNS